MGDNAGCGNWSRMGDNAEQILFAGFHDDSFFYIQDLMQPEPNYVRNWQDSSDTGPELTLVNICQPNSELEPTTTSAADTAKPPSRTPMLFENRERRRQIDKRYREKQKRTKEETLRVLDNCKEENERLANKIAALEKENERMKNTSVLEEAKRQGLMAELNRYKEHNWRLVNDCQRLRIENELLQRLVNTNGRR